MPERFRITSHVEGKSIPSSASRRPESASSMTERGMWQMYDWKQASPRMISTMSPPPMIPTGSIPAAWISSRGT